MTKSLIYIRIFYNTLCNGIYIEINILIFIFVLQINLQL
jgi:hypothetical protein